MRYIVTVKKEHPRQDGYPDGIVYEIRTSQLQAKWWKQGFASKVTLTDLLNEASEEANAGVEHWQ